MFIFEPISVAAVTGELRLGAKLLIIGWAINVTLAKTFNGKPDLYSTKITSDELPFKVSHTSVEFHDLLEEFRKEGWNIMVRGSVYNYTLDISRPRPETN